MIRRFLQFVLLLSPLSLAAQTFTVGSTTQQLNPTQRGSVSTYWPDGNMGAIFHGGTNYVFSMTNNPGEVQVTVPNLNTWSSGLSVVNPATNLQFASSSNAFDYNYIGGQAVYYDSTSGYLIMLYHGENWGGCPSNCSASYAALGLAYSTDFGNTWHKVGEVVSPQAARGSGGSTCQADIGTGTLLVVGSYFYTYYPETPTGCTNGEQLAVARASITSVITQVQNPSSFPTSGPGTLFMKYTGSGTWTGNGVTDVANPQNGGGAFATIAPYPSFNGHGYYVPNVRYDSYLNQYVLTYTDFFNIALATSPDGLTWNNFQNVATGGLVPPNAYSYPSLLNTSGGDPQVLGQNFSVFYVYPFGNWSNSSLYSVAISTSGGGGETLTVNTAGSGTGTIGGTNCSLGTTTPSSGTAVSCTGTPSGGSTLASVSGTGSASSCTTSPCSFTITANSTVTFTFNTSGGSCGSSSPYNAASPAESDVNFCINGPGHTAVNGDTIQIPCSGSQAATWTNTLTVPANITLTALGGAPNSGASTFGSGANCLTITSTVGILFELDPTYSASNNVVTLQNMTLVPGSGAYTPIHISGTGTSSGMPLFRVDNVQFGNGTAQWQYGTGSNTGEFDLIVNNAFGVADHDTTVSGSQNAFISVNLTSYFGAGIYGDNSWAQPDSTGGANNVFIENNQLSQLLWPIVENEQTYPNIGGGRAVTRFNHITASGIFFLTGGHGNDTDGRPRSMRTNETYGNTINCINGSQGNACYDFVSFRGGSGLTFGNTATLGSGAVWNEIGSLATYRIMGDGWAFSNEGSCGGATSGNAYGPFDQNDGTTYYSGTFTSGTSGVTLVASGSPGWSTNQWSNPSPFYPYSVWDVTQGWVSIIQSNGSNTLNVSQAPHGYINGGTAINAASGDSFQITRSKSCLDGGARGAGLLLQNQPAVLASTGAVGPANQVLDPVYEWDDVVPAVQYGDQFGLNFSPPAQLNREVFTDNSLGSPHVQTSPTSPFTGASGVGFGTLANRPTTCTANSVSGAPGPGYFATDQGSWNTSGNGFGQGVLTKCTATNTWGASYTPYQYPYPLAGGVTPQAATPVFSPTSGAHSSGTGVTISTSSSGCNPYIYWSPTHNPPTTGDTNSTSFTLTSAGTYYAIVIGCPGYTNSNVGSVTYTISAPQPPGLSGVTIQGAGVKFQ